MARKKRRKHRCETGRTLTVVSSGRTPRRGGRTGPMRNGKR